MITIQLHALKFYSYHGVHEEERLMGGEFELQIDVKFEERVNVITDLAETVNYSDLYEITSDQMKIAEPLIETVAMKIGNAIYSRFNFLKSITVGIKKMHPPILHFEGNVGIMWSKEY